jgi:signal transduction histidine kinase
VRRRLTLTVVGLLAGSLLLAGVGTLLITRANAKQQEIHQLQTEAQAIAAGFQGVQDRFRPIVRRQVLQTLAHAAHLEDAQVVYVLADGTLATRPPHGLTESDLDTRALLAGSTVSGSTGSLLFAAVPIEDATAAQAATPVRRPVIVLTETPGRLGPSWGYFFLVSAATLMVGAVVAARLASRASRPLRGAVAASQRIAGGALDAAVPVDRHDYPEIKSLAESINAMAAALARSKGLERQFLMSVSHDLRTPLTSIRGFAEAISEGAVPDEKEAAGVIASESRRLERLVGDLLDLARLDSRQFTLHLQPVDAGAVLADTAMGFRPVLEREGLALDTALAPAARLWTRADPDRLAQVIANLVENAFCFATTKVRVVARRAGASIELAVEDDGPGIPARELKQVFERLYQSSRPATRRQGSGLGLAIVAELVEAMGGTVTAESPVTGAGGTRMTISLAVDDTVVPARHEPSETARSLSPGDDGSPQETERSRPSQ